MRYTSEECWKALNNLYQWVNGRHEKNCHYTGSSREWCGGWHTAAHRHDSLHEEFQLHVACLFVVQYIFVLQSHWQ